MIFRPEVLSKKPGFSPKTVANEAAFLNEELDGSARIELHQGVYQLYVVEEHQDFESATVRLL